MLRGLFPTDVRRWPGGRGGRGLPGAAPCHESAPPASVKHTRRTCPPVTSTSSRDARPVEYPRSLASAHYRRGVPGGRERKTDKLSRKVRGGQKLCVRRTAVLRPSSRSSDPLVDLDPMLAA